MAETLIIWIVVGGIAGWLASLVVEGTGLGIIGDVLVGVVGAILGGVILSALLPGQVDFTGFNLTSFLVAFLGAVVLLFIIRAVSGRRFGRRFTRRRARI